MITEVDAAGNPVRTQSFSRADLLPRNDRLQAQYVTRDIHGREGRSELYNNLISVRKLVREVAGIPTATAVEVARPTSGTVRLDGDDLDPPAGYLKDGLDAAVALPNDADTQHLMTFARPLRNGDPSDANAGDIITQDPLRLTVYTSGHQILRPVVTPTTTETKVGAAPVSFSIASYDGPQPSGNLTYSWTFGDGSASSSAAVPPPHAWAADGTFVVKVEVTDGQQSRGIGTATVRVGKADKPTKPGPDKPGGGDDGTEGGPDDGDGTHENGDPDSPGGAGTDSSGDATPSPDEGKKNDGTVQPTGERVQGVLLRADQAVAVTAPRQPSAAPRAAAGRQATKIPTDWRRLLLLLPVALLAAGAVRQTPWLTRRIPELPWRRV